MTDTMLAFMREMLPEGEIEAPTTRGDTFTLPAKAIVTELISARAVLVPFAELSMHRQEHPGGKATCETCSLLSREAWNALRAYGELRVRQGDGSQIEIVSGRTTP